MSLIDKWEEEFKPLLGDTARWEGFRYIAEDQLGREKPVILETGTLRQPGNWAGDGQSTLVWEWIAKQKGGEVYSVDIRPPVMTCPGVHHVTMDSVGFLRWWSFQAPTPTLVYLDSYDYSPGQELNAAMHQVAELGAIWSRLPEGCLVASDDNPAVGSGKGALVRGLFGMIGKKPVVDGYMLVWKR